MIIFASLLMDVVILVFIELPLVYYGQFSADGKIKLSLIPVLYIILSFILLFLDIPV